MRVTFAHFHGDHKPGDNAEVDDAVARQLIHDGIAREAVPTRTRSSAAGAAGSTDPEEGSK